MDTRRILRYIQRQKNKLIFFSLGLGSLIWFLIRVIPKPSRATYPCQRAAFPVATGFILWLSGSLISFLSFRKAQRVFALKGFRYSIPLFAFVVLLSIGLFFTVPAANVIAGIKQAKQLPELLLKRNVLNKNSIVPSAYVAVVKSDKGNAIDITKDEIETMVNQAIELAGGLDDIISDGDVVILKPNLVTLVTQIRVNGVTTDWRVTAAVAKAVRGINPSGQILLLEGMVGNTSEAFSYYHYSKTTIPEIDELIPLETSCGAYRDYEAEELSVVTLPEGSKLYADDLKPYNSPEYYLNKRYLEADVLISIPVLKNHESAGVTGSIKNVSIGCSPPNIYAYEDNSLRGFINHERDNLHRFIHDFYMARPVDFAIMDGLQGLSYGPVGNDAPVGSTLSDLQQNMGLILASNDPIALDATEGLIMGDNPEQVGYLVYLNNSGLGCSDPMAIKIAGTQISGIKKDFPHVHPDAQADDYDDFTAPSASINNLSVTSGMMTIQLDTASDVARVDVEINKQVYPPIFTSGFNNIEVDLSVFNIPNGELNVAVHVHDSLLNTISLTRDIVLSSQSFSADVQLRIYPNPVQNILTINCPDVIVNIVQLFNSTGQLVYSERTDMVNSFKLDCNELMPGTYYGKLITQKGSKGFSFIKTK